MNKDIIYCTIKYKHCKKQKSCKNWIANYDEEIQIKALYDSNIFFVDGLVCINSGYENFKEFEDEKRM